MTLWIENQLLISLAFIGRIYETLDWESNSLFLSPSLAGLMTLLIENKLLISLAFIGRTDDNLFGLKMKFVIYYLAFIGRTDDILDWDIPRISRLQRPDW
jgi:hypothetical protein